MSRSQIVLKSIFRIFVLRVSGKGDHAGSANQFEVLRGYEHVPGVPWLLKNFDIAIMQASSSKGRLLREEWQRRYALKVLSRQGRDDFLGVTLVVEGTRFVLYASTASQMDEDSGNAFTRYLIEFIKEPAFTGHADPDFMARRDAGTLECEDHPSLCNAFDATRFVRSLPLATDLWEAAKWGRGAFDVKDVRVDPEGGEAQAMIWSFLAFGSQMENEVGKQRRFVGKLNLARAGFFPYKEELAPLGTTTSEGKLRSLLVHDAEVPAVAALYRLGLAKKDLASIARILGSDHDVRSSDPKTRDTPIHLLDEPAAAARRLFLRHKLAAYRDGTYELAFVGILPNRLQPGSGHVLKRRWLGLNADGRHDEYGAISYRIPMPKPTVSDPDGNPRQGWIDGITEQDERDGWTALIDALGWDDRAATVAVSPSAEVDLLTTAAARSGPAGGPAGVTALSRLCLFRDDDAGANGPRTKLFSRAQSGRYELRRETATPTREGVKYDETTLLASWPDHELRRHVAALLRAAAHQLLADERELAPLRGQHPTDAQPNAEAEEAALRAEAAKQRKLADGYDRCEAEERASDEPVQERLDALREQARAARQRARELSGHADVLSAAEPTLADFGQLRDVIAALEGVHATGLVPTALNRALREVLPGGLRFAPGPDSLELTMSGTVEVPLAEGGTASVAQSVLVPHAAGRGTTPAGELRITDLARRYMRDGQPIEQVAAAGRIKDPDHVLRLVRETLTSGARRVDGQLDVDEMTLRMPDPGRRSAAFACPIPELRAVVWHRLTGSPGRPSGATTAWARLVTEEYFAAPLPHPSGRSASGYSRPWAWESNVDHRLEQHSILLALPGPAKRMRADHLGDALGVANTDATGRRLVLDSSIDLPRNGHTYPRTLRRVGTAAQSDGWYGTSSQHLDAARKLVELPACPHVDCPERYATAIVFAREVLAFGTAMLCRRCRRPAADTAEARATVFPASVVLWADAQPRRHGRWVKCAADGCTIDLGAGPGKAWRWDDASGPVWHGDACRVGEAASARFGRCGYSECALDEGDGPGSVDISGRRRSRRWHGRQCEHAEDRRLRTVARAARFTRCAWSGCTVDDGDGPGSIKGAHHAQKTHDNPTCRAGIRGSR